MLVQVEHHATDGSGRVRRTKVEANAWHRGILEGSNGPQHRWYYVFPDSSGRALATASIYEDRNPYWRLKHRRRTYRWTVYPAGVGYAYARGECVKLCGAKVIAEQCAKLFIAAYPYNEKVHKA